MPNHIIFAPHLDDEIIGCYSILDKSPIVVYYQRDHRENGIPWNHYGWEPVYIPVSEFGINVDKEDTIYIPSRFDLHPLHRQVRNEALSLPCKKMFYSTSMNVPWLEEEKSPTGKESLLAAVYEEEWQKYKTNHHWFLFKSIKPFDEIIWAVIRFRLPGIHRWDKAPNEVGFLRHDHRHLFHIEVKVQQFHNDRDVEYLTWQGRVKSYAASIINYRSCEDIAVKIKRHLENKFQLRDFVEDEPVPARLVEVSVFEDGENGCLAQ